MKNNLHRIDQHPDQQPDTPGRTDSAIAIDTAIASILRLKGMFGAVTYLMNADGTRRGYPSEHFENWFMDIQYKLDDLVDTLTEAWQNG